MTITICSIIAIILYALASVAEGKGDFKDFF
jgi:hypothetical protein